MQHARFSDEYGMLRACCMLMSMAGYHKGGLQHASLNDEYEYGRLSQERPHKRSTKREASQERHQERVMSTAGYHKRKQRGTKREGLCVMPLV